MKPLVFIDKQFNHIFQTDTSSDEGANPYQQLVSSLTNTTGLNFVLIV